MSLSALATTIDSFEIDQDLLKDEFDAPEAQIPKGSASAKYRALIPINSDHLNDTKHSAIVSAEIEILEDQAISSLKGGDFDLHFLPIEIAINFSDRDETNFNKYRSIQNLDITGLVFVLERAGLSISTLGYEYFQHELGIYQMHSFKLAEIDLQRAFRISKDGGNQIILKGYASFNLGDQQLYLDKIADDDETGPYIRRSGSIATLGGSFNIKLNKGILITYFTGADLVSNWVETHSEIDWYLTEYVEGIKITKALDRDGNFSIYSSVQRNRITVAPEVSYRFHSDYKEKHEMITIEAGIGGRW